MALPSTELSEAERAVEALCRTAGIACRLECGRLWLVADHLTQEVVPVWLSRIREADLDELKQPHTPPRVFATTTLSQAVLRSAPGLGVHLADSGGNGHLELSGLRVHVEGRPIARPRALGASVHRARLLFAVLRADGTAHRRELAAIAGLQPAVARRHLADFERRGWIKPAEGDRVEVADRRAVIREWQASYVEGLRPELLLTQARPIGFDRFDAWCDWLAQHQPNDVLLGGQLAAAEFGHDLLPATAALHVPALSAEVLRGCRVLPDPTGPVALLRRLGSRDYDERRPELADPLLVLGELEGDEDPRVVLVGRSVRESVDERLAG
jgi:hypothetical protein